MKQSRIVMTGFCLAAVAVIVFSAYQLVNMGRQEVSYEVSVVVNDSSNDRWIAFKEGLEQGAEDYSIHLNVVTTADFESLEDEETVIEREIAGGAEGIIVQLCASTGTEELLQEYETSVALVLVETDAEPTETYAAALPDNEGIGAALADAAAEDADGALTGKTIGILAGNQEQLAMQQRLDSFVQAAQAAGGDILWTLEAARGDDDPLAQQLAEQPVDILAALENDETERAVDALLSAQLETLLYGVGCSEKNVYYLDKGTITGLVVPNEFNMGYQSVALMAGRLQSRKTERVETGFVIVDKATMYDTDNQKVLFPIVQ
ncbi:MAG: substrate-binding domain-containing protein [Clostridiales bacterium]|nr:substrate-binding domain-containing protein [Clostridiales bacterium]